MESMIKLGGLEFNSSVMNAAGTCKTVEDVDLLCGSPVGAVMVGSITVEPRTINAGRVWHKGEIFSLNSYGMPNGGLAYYRRHLPEMIQLTHSSGKLLMVSVAGFTPDEYRLLVEMAFEVGADMVELNFGCPNVWEGGLQKRITSFEPDLIKQILSIIPEGGKDKAIAVKVSPYSDPALLLEVAKIVANSGNVQAVTAINTFPNAYLMDVAGSAMIEHGEGLAGLNGPALKPIALGQVKQFRAVLPDEIGMIGVGGISAAADVRDFQSVGATLVQVATAYLSEGVSVFKRLV